MSGHEIVKIALYRSVKICSARVLLLIVISILIVAIQEGNSLG